MFRKSGAQGIVYANYFHIYWLTKYKRDVLCIDAQQRLSNILYMIAGENEAEILRMRLSSESVYLRIGVDPQLGIHRLVKRLKRASSKELSPLFPEIRSRIPTLWTNAYFCATCDAKPTKDIASFADSQDATVRRDSA